VLEVPAGDPDDLGDGEHLEHRESLESGDAPDDAGQDAEEERSFRHEHEDTLRAENS